MSALLSIALFRRVGQVSNSFHFNGKIFNGAIVNNLNSFHTTKFTQGFDEFQDPVKEDSIEFITGRAWTPADLRRKVIRITIIFLFIKFLICLFVFLRALMIFTNYGLFYIKKEIFY